MNKSPLAVSVVVLSSIGFAGCPGFNPTGTWDVNYDRAEAFSTYTSAAAINVSTNIEDIIPGPIPPLATGVVISYDAASNTATVAGTPYVLDANHSVVLNETNMPMGIPGCMVNEYTRETLTFTGAEGHSADYRQESGWQITGCTALLAAAKANILSTGMVPSELQAAVFFGGLRVATLDQATSFGVAIVAVGTRVSASEGAEGSAVQTLEFPGAVSMEALKAATARSWALVNSAGNGDLQPILDAVRAARGVEGI